MEKELNSENQVLTLQEKIEQYKIILENPTLKNPLVKENGHIRLRSEIEKMPLLDAEEEVKFAQKIEEGEEEYKEYFFVANLNFLAYMARKLNYLSSKFNYIDTEDLINTGAIGLWQAVEKFDYRMNLRFTTYAGTCIHRTIQREILHKSQDIYHPTHVHFELYRFRKSVEDLTNKFGRLPHENEIVDNTDWNKNEVQKLNKMSIELQTPISLEKPISQEDQESTLSEFIEDKNAINPEEAAIKEVSNTEMKKFLLDNLNDIERNIIELRFGFIDNKIMNIENTAKKLDISLGKARAIESKALRKLRFVLERET